VTAQRRMFNEDDAPAPPAKRRRYLATTPRINHQDSDESSSMEIGELCEQAESLLEEVEAYLTQTLV